MNNFEPPTFARFVIEAVFIKSPDRRYTFYSDISVEVDDYVIVDSQNGPGIAKVLAVKPYQPPEAFKFVPRYVVMALYDFEAQVNVARKQFKRVSAHEVSGK